MSPMANAILQYNTHVFSAKRREKKSLTLLTHPDGMYFANILSLGYR
jgi:hypothetical protein